MIRKSLLVENVPAILWGEKADKLIIAVHGDQSCKDDAVIEVLAETASEKGCQVLSFDLPKHGDRKEAPHLCDPQNCVHDLNQILAYAQTISENISVFGCSMGAYFAMLAFRDERIKKAYFLSPVVDMKRLIENMMLWFDVSPERLEKEKEVPTVMNTLYWHYYQYVLQHPITWDKPTALLYGGKDELCEYEYVKAFAERCNADMTVLADSGHFFHTEIQLDFFRRWLWNILDI